MQNSERTSAQIKFWIENLDGINVVFHRLPISTAGKTQFSRIGHDLQGLEKSWILLSFLKEADSSFVVLLLK